MATVAHPTGAINTPSQTLLVEGNTILAASKYHVARFNDDGSLDIAYGNEGVSEY